MFCACGILVLAIGFIIQTLAYSTGIVNNDYILLLFIFPSAFFLIYDLTMQFPKKIGHLIFGISLIRFVIMFWNIYGRDIFLLPGVGTDTEYFYHSAVLFSENLNLFKMADYGGYYSKYLGILYSFTGPSYLLGSYLNFIYGLLTIRIINKVLKGIATTESVYNKGILIFAAAPTNMIICSSLRRESLLMLFVALSIREIYKWTKTGKNMQTILAFAFLLLASILHAGIIGLALGYVYLILFYNPKKETYSFGIKTIGIGILFVLATAFIFYGYSSLFLNKLMVEDEEMLYRRMSRIRGGSAYLTSISVSSPRDVLVYSPLKICYFLLSPMPWDWRAMPDVIAFTFDSLLYLYLIVELLKNYWKSTYPTKLGFTMMFLGSLVIYAMGSQNAANAMRHRCKLFSIIVILFCIVKGYKEVAGHYLNNKM